jgi:hypothetical protein
VGKQEHVPETTDPKPNRAMRRHPEKTDPTEEARVREEQEEILKRGTDDDVSVRAKSSGHGKKTADKWNQ